MRISANKLWLSGFDRFELFRNLKKNYCWREDTLWSQALGALFSNFNALTNDLIAENFYAHIANNLEFVLLK